MVHCRLLDVHTLFRFALIAGTVLILPTLAAAGNAVPSSADWLGLRMCESHNQYAENAHNGYYGAYQFSMRAWESVGGTGRPDLSTPAEQDYRALLLYQARGWRPWPACARRTTGGASRVHHGHRR